ncbi:hypothetical protein FQN60_006696, partial [Etheostoma spectabile]
MPHTSGSPSVPVTVATKRHKVEVREFSDAVLSCTFRTENDQNPRIEWKKKGKDISFVYFDGQFKPPFEGRATIEGATVTLQRVTQEDAGDYRCEISAPLDSVILGETNITLKVLVPPHTPSCEIPSAAVTGSVVQLRCRDQQSIPPATYSWFKDSKPIGQPRHGNATYLINPHTGVLDVNVPAVVAAVVVVCLVIVVCGCGGFLLHRNGFFSPGHRGRSNVNYIPPPQECVGLEKDSGSISEFKGKTGLTPSQYHSLILSRNSFWIGSSSLARLKSTAEMPMFRRRVRLTAERSAEDNRNNLL